MFFRNLGIAFLLFVAQPATGEGLAQNLSLPSQAEREFWASTHQIGTVAAYQAYLNAFPKGFFAPLASAAIKKADDLPIAASPQNYKLVEEGRDSTSIAGHDQFSPHKIAGQTKSRDITQRAGDVFHGPGPMTVGRVGARKQIVVPNGKWVLLAAVDRLSTHRQPMAVTELVLAKIEGDTFRSFLVAEFNSKVGDSKNYWTHAVACESDFSSNLFGWKKQEFWVTECVKSALFHQTDAANVFSREIWKEALWKLTAGGGAFPSGPYILTEMFYTGDSSNYLKISRFDFGASPDDIALDVRAISRDLTPSGREKWAKEYSALAALGYRKKIAAGELNAGSRATITSTSIPD